MGGERVRMGMIGGGPGAFIGAIHRHASALDGDIELVCGAFSSDATTSQSFGSSLHLPPARCYPNYQALFEQEAKLPTGERMQFVAVVTPNHLHFEICRMAFEHGFHVFCEKPATMSTREALELAQIQESSGCLFALAHTYTGYPMIKEARQLVAAGGLGRIVKIVVEYTQGWLASSDADSSKQASWRLDPTKSGVSCCMGDIGVHGANLAEYVSGTSITELCADVGTVVPGRQLDDDGAVLLRFQNGARGALLASQIHIGDENNLRLRVVGDYRALEWSQLEPNTLWVKSNSESTQMRRAGVGALSPQATGVMRTPAGHPEGYIEAFANLYRSFVAQVRKVATGGKVAEDGVDLPGMQSAIRGMAFIENVIAASQSDKKWVPHAVPTGRGALQ
ncbi:MAG: Gfo/Idh/MocA family oxidoreductase [Pseudomonadota bacterium]